MWDKVVDIDKCHLQQEPANAIRNCVKQFALDNNLEFFNHREKSGFLRTLMKFTLSGFVSFNFQFIKRYISKPLEVFQTIVMKKRMNT